MKTKSPNQLALALRDFFGEFLPCIRNVSPHTIASYRDSLVLLLRFVAAQQRRCVSLLDFNDVSADLILSFLADLESKRHNTATTRNVRLSAIHAFFRYLAGQHPDRLEHCQRVLVIPFKRARQRTIEYLEYEEIQHVLSAVDQSTRDGRRDYALLATLFNTGARVQEILDLRACDVQLTKPFQVRLFGKGRKERFCPLWPQTARLLRSFFKERLLEPHSEQHVFLNHRGESLTRFGVRYLLRKYQDRAKVHVAGLRGKRLHPHSLRHSTAVALLKAGVDLSTISQWLGHASPNTTNKYATIDLEMKRAAIAKVKPVRGQRRSAWRNRSVLDWLEGL
ncbi:MAG: site-specific integrase [Acidobacteriota bacterium]|nr:site-specific integrase [Acidobacteriota bacterium]